VDHSNITSLYQTEEHNQQWMVNRKRSGQDRLTAGYGESQLINKCADNVNCTAEEHQVNRRSEFIIIEL
jgi:outer membrane protein OmpA-like peptidoglycan-associated protein